MDYLKYKPKDFNVYLFCAFWQYIIYLLNNGLKESLNKLFQFFIIWVFD